MPGYSRIRRQQLLQEAEGYLDLIMAMPDAEPPHHGHRAPLAQRALHALDQLATGEANHLRALYLRGQALRLLERYHQAIDALLAASAIDPENYHVQLALGWCYKRVGRVDLAIATLEDALEVDSERGILHYNLACYWSLARNVGLTLYHLNRAFELQSDYRHMVAREPDFDGVREHPEFLALTQPTSQASSEVEAAD